MGISTSAIVNNIRATAPFRKGSVKMTKPGDYIPDYNKMNKGSVARHGKGDPKQQWSRFESQMVALGEAMKSGKARLAS